jgi:ABC-type bacteriocin/lantibiotic exporter with double-glycine peptidase domain
MRESGAVLGWIWRELVSPEGKQLLMRMFGAMLLASLLLALQPLVFAQIINHAEDSEIRVLLTLVGGLAALTVMQLGAHLLQETLREHAWNRVILSMVRRINELFYEKSLGQHAEEGSTLNYTTIDRGKSRVETIQQMLLFDTGGMLIQLTFSYLLIWVISWWAGVVATVLILVHLLWSLYLNYHVARETE